MGNKKMGKITIPKNGTQLERIIEMFTLAGMDSSTAAFEPIAERVKSSNGTVYDVTEQLLEHHLKIREERRIQSWIQSAKLAPLTTITDFDFSLQPSIDPVLVNDLASCRFVDQGKNVILLGPPGVGKTHLAVALGYEAVLQGKETRCMKLNEFIEAVHKSAADSLVRLHRSLVRPALLILDDIDYYTTDEESGKFLFEIIKRRYDDKTSTIITSNKNPKDWGNLFGPGRTAAALDRLFDHHRAITINIGSGTSYRVPRPISEADEQPTPTPVANHQFLKKVTTVFSKD